MGWDGMIDSTADLGRGLRATNSIEAGAVHINSMTIHDEPTLPDGGFKKSGLSRFNGSVGMDEFLTTKIITFEIKQGRNRMDVIEGAEAY
jgi:acyl-CoA reductase-like NAD-dependent aldehyde dehydrogenase